MRRSMGHRFKRMSRMDAKTARTRLIEARLACVASKGRGITLMWDHKIPHMRNEGDLITIDNSESARTNQFDSR